MKKILCIFLCFSLMFLFAGCSGDSNAPENQKISYTLPAEPKTLDPQVASDYASHIVILNLFEGLVRIGQDGSARPGVAESWSANSDNTIFTFTLRADAMWPEWTERNTVTGEDGKQKTETTTHPAEPVTAKDFVYGLRRALEPATDSPAAENLFAIKNAEAVHSGSLPVEELGVRADSERTLVIELKYPYEDFPSLMAIPAAMPCNQAFFEYTRGQYGLETESILGNGPYEMANRYAWDHNNTLSLKRSKSYQSESEAIPLALSFTIGEEEDSDPVEAVTSQKVDACALPGGFLTEAQEAGLTITSFEDTTWGIVFNLQARLPRQDPAQVPVFSNLSLRKGFLQCIDREYLMQSLPAGYQEASDIIPPETTLGGKAYRPQAGSGFSLAYSENAGSMIRDGLSQLGADSSVLSDLTILCPDDSESRQMVSTLLEIWNKQLGYYFNMEPVDTDTLSSRLERGDYVIAFAPFRAQEDGPDKFLNVFASTTPENPAGLQSGEFDALLNSAENRTPEEAAERYAAAERYLCDNAIFYPIAYEKRYFASAANVTGIHFLSYNAGIDFSQAIKTVK